MFICIVFSMIDLFDIFTANRFNCIIVVLLPVQTSSHVIGMVVLCWLFVPRFAISARHSIRPRLQPPALA
ncbi:hypothetical protein BV898_18421 [Hypsibius exemplaris]|uniref:Uncharacterized protein n=1 Tax=Hypsibius exemplaris TaxID=2072580 RepID=A0A9X6NJA7_HYPEX|nr:hypothetical protein BV898_18421 [Hypsibius exemplaris]